MDCRGRFDSRLVQKSKLARKKKQLPTLKLMSIDCGNMLPYLTYTCQQRTSRY
ncbi:hypothetical protein ZOSMA_26G00690 [Zostera marina]|uniref:Uncharacterized protein n=1 Tax=Zostera marina TaxID=29655 RepID=A0A0K9PGH6_ZOSMR|nr:hypothetical protein ZOSMA_26G00690 [Zostera marina]